ncbi:DUF1727 domain-containing protein [Candidatus Saccharibacteria bacterium]|nr:DUF1727 domain-containing protein [Candidatus Saccharibacteria bacterium]
MLNIVFIWFAKVLGWGLRATGHHGAALPGLIVEKLHPGFLDSMLHQLPEGVIVVSGTNGKTTTTKIITQLLRSQNRRVLTNKTGGNFVRGIFSTVAQAASLSAKLPYDMAVVELDEAYAARFVRLHRPRVSLVLNVTRDQLDRFGEIDTTAKLLQQVVNNTKELIVLNDDDNRAAAMTPPATARAAYFGISKNLTAQFPNDEQLYAQDKPRTLPHKREVELTKIVDSSATYKIGDQLYSVNLKMDGQHNALNAAAALGVLLGLYPRANTANLLKILSDIEPAFGRGELIDYRGRKLILQLIKNPASFRQALHVLDIHQPSVTAIVINDDYADGRDVSWLWDIDFEALSGVPKPILTSGVRAYDMALRLKYDQIAPQKVTPDIKQMLDVLEAQTTEGQTAIIYATYTAMLAVRRVLAKRTRVARV